MKRIVRFLTPSVMLLACVSPALSFSLTGSFSREIFDAVEAVRTRLNAAREPKGAEFAISTFDKRIVDSFGVAWRRSGNGSSSVEGVVLILRGANLSYIPRELGATNEYKRFTFAWHPATIAIVHTHPNTSDPQPHDEDILAADKHRVPVFTITNRGMFVYDPGTKKISRVMDSLDWLEPAKWVKAALGR